MSRHSRSSAIAARSSRLERDAPGVVDAIEQQADVVATQVFVHRFAAACPMTVVVYDQNAAGAEQRIEMLELVMRRLIPVGVEPQNRDRRRHRARQRVLDPARYEVDALRGIPG